MTNPNTFSPAIELDALGYSADAIEQLGVAEAKFSGKGIGAFRQGMIDSDKEVTELSSVSESLAIECPHEYAHGINAAKFITEKGTAESGRGKS